MLWVIVTVLIVTLVIWAFYIKPYSHWKSMGVPQTKPWIFLGDTWPSVFRRKDLREWMNWMYYMYPESKYVGMYQFRTPILMLRDLELIKQLAVKDFDHFTDHTNMFAVDEDVDPLWGKNLFALKGQRWRDMRSLLSGSFTSSKMRIMYTLIEEESEKFVNHFLKKNEETIDLELKDTFTRYTNDVIASTSFGIKVDSLENPNNEFFLLGKEVSNFTGVIVLIKFLGIQVFPRLFKLLNIQFFPARVSKFFYNIINETIKAREEQGIVRPDMINLLLEVKKGLHKDHENEVHDSGFAVVQESLEIAKPNRKRELTNMDIASQALIFFLAGFDSVASAMCYASYELALNPDIQEKLRKEIKETFEKTEGKPTYEDILQMKYLDMVVTETLRKWPVAPATDRVCVKPYTIPPSTPEEPTITFEKNAVVWIPIYNIHHDSKYYPDPDKFIPERFSEENKGNIKPYTYMPFGVGPRACIGSRFALLEIKSVLVHFLNSFEIVPSEKTQIPLKFSRAAINFTPEGGFPLRLKRL